MIKKLVNSQEILKTNNILIFKATSNPKEVMHGGGLLPLGGDEESSGYKGYGLTFMVEILCGILAGSRFGPNIRTWQTSSGEANLVIIIRDFKCSNKNSCNCF